MTNATAETGFDWAQQVMSTARSQEKGKPLANNTRLEWRDVDTIAVRFHATDIVTFRRDGSCELNTGGWYTVTTKERINRYAPTYVSSERGTWWVAMPANPDDPEPDYGSWNVPEIREHLDPGATVPEHECKRGEPDNNLGYRSDYCNVCSQWEWAKGDYDRYRANVEQYGGIDGWKEAKRADRRRVRELRKIWREWRARNRVDFFDGIKFDPNGYPLNAEPHDPRAEQREKERTAMRKRITAFCKLAEAELERGMPMPSNGDCWLCSMRDVETGEPWGDIRGDDHDHLLSHMEEEYVVPSLLVNALRERGYQDVGIYFHLGMDPEANTMGGTNRWSRECVKRDLATYMKKRLIPDAATH